jgi:hypothetical protein
MPCDAPNTDAVPRPLGNPINGVDTLPTFIGRAEQILPDGTCILAGRQTLATIGNSAATGWTDPSGSHNVSLSLGIAHAFVRALKNDPALSSKDRYQAIANRIMAAIGAIELRDSRGE